MSLDRIDVIFRLATLDELESQPVHSGLINTAPFFRNCYFGWGFNYMHYDLEEYFPQSAFCQCYLGCGSNRLCFDNSLGGKVSLHLVSHKGWSRITVVLSGLSSPFFSWKWESSRNPPRLVSEYFSNFVQFFSFGKRQPYIEFFNLLYKWVKSVLAHNTVFLWWQKNGENVWTKGV